MRPVQPLMLVLAAIAITSSSAVAQGVISDNDCTISLGPTTLLVPQYSGEAPTTSEATVVFTATFATQGCSCVDPGDTGFDNPDDIKLVTPGGDELDAVQFNDIDGYAQFDYVVSVLDLAAGRRRFQVKIFDSCGGTDVLVDSADFDVMIHAVQVPKATPPVITAQPQNRTAWPGTSVSFTVAATGSPVLVYQWYRNGALIPGANAATFTIPAVTAADNFARFKVMVLNGGGTVTSSEAILIVTQF